MSSRITIDSAGRVVIPKAVRQSLRLRAGDALELDSTPDCVTLRPVREFAALVKEQGIWVYHTGAPLADMSICDLIDEARDQRIEDILG